MKLMNDDLLYACTLSASLLAARVFFLDHCTFSPTAPFSIIALVFVFVYVYLFILFYAFLCEKGAD